VKTLMIFPRTLLKSMSKFNSNTQAKSSLNYWHQFPRFMSLCDLKIVLSQRKVYI